MIDKTNFIEPTEKFAKDFGEGAKDWFNADMIFFALEIEKEKGKKNVPYPITKQYKEYCKIYVHDLSVDELMKQFGSYTEEEFNDFMEIITNNLTNKLIR